MQSLVTSSSAFTSSAVLCFTDAPGSKLKTWNDIDDNEFTVALSIYFFFAFTKLERVKCCVH